MNRAPILLVAVSCSTVPAAAQQSQPAFPSPVGWQWAFAPQAIAEHEKDALFSGKAGDVAFTFDRTGDMVRLRLSGPPQRGGWLRDTEYRGVVIDASGRRFVVQFGTSSTDRKGWRADRWLPAAELKPADARYAGIEMLTPQGRREQSRDALRRAREKGCEVLPLPIIGERYEFRLTTHDGKTADSESYRGKVLLIDGWATWCTPCMQKMPALKKLYEKLHDQGFEIIGVNFDNKPSRGRAAIEKLELKWPQVFVPADDETRELFDQAGSFMPLPRLVLIGRDGVVAAVCSPGTLEEEVTKLVARPPATQSAPASP